MAKLSRRFVCQNCGEVHSKWSGKCDSCGSWNSIEEESLEIASGLKRTHPGRAIDLVGLEGSEAKSPRSLSGIAEFDRVTGGGIVPGSAILIGGDPGIGKSTLLLQILANLSNNKSPAIYVSGEEAISQVRLRAERLGTSKSNVLLAAETNISDILATLDSGLKSSILAIDSIQTIWSPQLDSAPGTVSQVRQSAQTLIHHAKKTGTAVLLVGHVTKEGQIAGPRVIEHMVDTVLYFEGERGNRFRILRAVKNRFGATDEIGVFEMTGSGLVEVSNPSSLFLAEREEGTTGAAVFAGVEGTRPVLVEIQALVAQSTLGTPRRSVVGWDQNRLSTILAVLDAHCGLSFSNCDVYLNIAGGLKIREPAGDLAVAAALVSALSGKPLPTHTVIFGEVSLSGGIRSVSQTAARLREAEKLGFRSAILAQANSNRQQEAEVHTIQKTEFSQLTSLVARIASLS